MEPNVVGLEAAVLQLSPLQVPGAEAFGLRLVGVQTSWQGSLCVETTALPGTELSVTGYLQHYQLTDLRDPALTNLKTVASDLLARREAIAYGLEVMARRSLGRKVYGWISYTLSKSLHSYGGGAVGPSDWDQRHVFSDSFRIVLPSVGVRCEL